MSVTDKEEEAHKQLIATASKRLANVEDELVRIGSFTYVCIQALAAPSNRDDASEDIAVVLDHAYAQLIESVLTDVRDARDALKALSQGDGQ